MATSLETLEQLAAGMAEGRPAPSKRMLVIANPYATTVSDRLKHLSSTPCAGASRSTRSTPRPAATPPSCAGRPRSRATTSSWRSAATARSTRPPTGWPAPTRPWTCLPGGSTNVFCRLMGIPAEIVDATEHLLGLADDWRPRRVDLGEVNGRAFTFSAGVGLDASVVERVDAHPHLKARLGEWYFTWAALQHLHPPLHRAPAPDDRGNGRRDAGPASPRSSRTSSPYTYFNRRPIELAEGAEARRRQPLRSGAAPGSTHSTCRPCSGAPSRAASTDPAPPPVSRAFTGLGPRWEGPGRWTTAPLPLQVDGDHIGYVDRASFGIRPGELLVVG